MTKKINTMKTNKIPFTEKDVKAYLDKCINHWRNVKNALISRGDEQNDIQMCDHYIDAFQSVRISVFGELLD